MNDRASLYQTQSYYVGTAAIPSVYIICASRWNAIIPSQWVNVFNSVRMLNDANVCICMYISDIPRILYSMS